MKYCVNFDKHLNLTNYQIDEYIIEYKSNQKHLLEFLDEHLDKRIILFASEEYDLVLFSELCKKYPNLVIKFKNYNENLIEDILELGFPFFYDIHVSNWDVFLGLIDLGVTDIYIVEDLGFELDKIAAIAKQENVKLRAFPNVAQSAWADTASLMKFFIRPEDLQIYEQYIDVFEFFGSNKAVLPTLLKIYQRDKKWFGPLNEIIISLNDNELDSRFIIPSFAEHRISCGKKCLKGNKCRMCHRIMDLSKSFKKTNIYVNYEKINKEGEK